MIAPAFCMWRFAIAGELNAPPDHPQSSLNPQGTVGPPGLPVVVGGFADAPEGASRIARTLAAAARDAPTRLTNPLSHIRRPAPSRLCTDLVSGENTHSSGTRRGSRNSRFGQGPARRGTHPAPLASFVPRRGAGVVERGG